MRSCGWPATASSSRCAGDRWAEVHAAGTALITLANDPLRVRTWSACWPICSAATWSAPRCSPTAALRRSVLDDEIARLSARTANGVQQRVDFSWWCALRLDGRSRIDPRLQVIGRYLPRGQVVAHVLPGGAPPVRRACVGASTTLLAAASRRPGPIRVALGAWRQRDALPAQLRRATPRAAVIPTAAEAKPVAARSRYARRQRAEPDRARAVLRTRPAAAATAVATMARALVTFDPQPRQRAALIPASSCGAPSCAAER